MTQQTQEERNDKSRVTRVMVRGTSYDCLSYLKQSAWTQDNEEIVAVALRCLAENFSGNKREDIEFYKKMKKLV